jgi:predicted nuclease of predicted toxin-antitoxin system
MPTFLIDENLPKVKIPLWNSADFIHSRDLGISLQDIDIWNYAKENNMVIVSRDSDFYNRIVASEPPPKVIFFKDFNLRLEKLKVFVQANWSDVISLLDSNKLVYVFEDQIVGYN